MATYAEIQKFVQRHHGFIPKTGWIAHVKEVHGVPTLRGANRARRDRDIEPCPPEKREAIEDSWSFVVARLSSSPLSPRSGERRRASPPRPLQPPDGLVRSCLTMSSARRRPL